MILVSRRAHFDAVDSNKPAASWPGKGPGIDTLFRSGKQRLLMEDKMETKAGARTFRNFRITLVIAIIIVVISQLTANETAFSQETVTQFQITIDPIAHQTYGLYYPVTYMFQIPSGSSNLVAQYRYNPTDDWTSLTPKTSSDFFNGINAVRFDYPNNVAYISVAFSLNSDAIYVRVLNGQTEIPISYSGIPNYYDGRHAAVTVTLDDWVNQSSYWDTASRILTAARVHFSVGIISSGNPDWALIQSWYDQGYLEPAAHTRTHPCDDAAYQLAGYDWEVAGVRDDILAHLTLNYPYVPAFFEPCGFESAQVRQAVAAAHYIADRGWVLPRSVQNTFAPWGQDGVYQRVLYSYDTYNWPQTGSAALRDEANASFDTAYAAGGIYHLVDHPWQGHWSDGSYLAQHISYISNRPDVWYAGFGELYLYHFVQERGLVTVAPAGTPFPTAWTQTDWVGGGGQAVWSDGTRYDSASNIDSSMNGQLQASVVSSGSVLFSDGFARGSLPPWTAQLGTWAVTNGELQGSSPTNQFAYSYYYTSTLWTDYSVEGRIQFPTGAFGGGLGGRLDSGTGAHYGAWVFPDGSAQGANTLQLIKFRDWTTWSGTPMLQVNLPSVGTGWHTLKLAFNGNRIRVYYDGEQMMDVTDNNFDSRPAYTSGGISVDMWTYASPYIMSVDDISVATLAQYANNGTLLSSAFDGGAGVQWGIIFWDAAVSGSTSVRVRTRTADQADQLSSAPWSDYYTTSGSSVTSLNKRWIQYELSLTTNDSSTPPVFYDIGITYVPGANGS